MHSYCEIYSFLWFDVSCLVCSSHTFRIKFKSFVAFRGPQIEPPYTADRLRFLSYQSLIVVYFFFYAERICVSHFFVAEIKNRLFMYIDASFYYFLCLPAVTAYVVLNALYISLVRTCLFL